MNNLKNGLHATLVSAFRAKGLSKMAAAAKATKYLAAAESHFDTVLAERKKNASKAPPSVPPASAAKSALTKGTSKLKVKPRNPIFAKLSAVRDRLSEAKLAASDSPQAAAAALRSVARWARTL
jgi:hypothetical protein